MTSAESLQRYGTISFGLDFMHYAIVFNPAWERTADATAWFACVPESYRDDVLAAIEPALQEFFAHVRKRTDNDLHHLVCVMHSAILQHVEPRLP